MPGCPRREFSDAEIDAAVQVISDPARLEDAQRVVASAAPSLQAILENALEAAEWFGSAHRAQVMEATGQEDPMERLDAVQRLIVEETRVSMLDRRGRRVRTGARAEREPRRRLNGC